ncbi:MAG: hypothetical protein P8Y18_01855, partial [Candidatus Bathyarchaeota archaeon]
MNKYIGYSLLAILLGILTITVPIALFNIEDNENTIYDRSDGNELPPEGIDSSFEPAITEKDLVVSPISGLISIGILVVPSLLIAIGVFALSRKKLVN